jgi:hypothetical protein
MASFDVTMTMTLAENLTRQKARRVVEVKPATLSVRRGPISADAWLVLPVDMVDGGSLLP